MPRGNADTFGDSGSELWWGDDFGMTAVAENQAFKFIVYNHFQ